MITVIICTLSEIWMRTPSETSMTGSRAHHHLMTKGWKVIYRMFQSVLRISPINTNEA